MPEHINAGELAAEHAEPLEGRTIEAVRPMTDDEQAAYGWSHHRGGPAVVLFLDDGTVLVPQRDPEGNGPGTLVRRSEETVTYVTGRE